MTMQAQTLQAHKPSDHRPIVADLTYRDILRPRRKRYTLANWNTNHDTDAPEARPVFEQIMDHDPQVVILQEIQRDGDGILPMLADEYGLAFRHAEPEFAIAWQRGERFRYVRHFAPIMSQTPYWLTHNRAIVVVLEDTLTGRLTWFMSEHPPAHVVRPDHPTHKNVLAVHREFANKRERLAERAAARGHEFTSWGDSNIDPLKDWKPKDGGWDFRYDPRRNGGLAYVRADAPTHGGHRHIDEGALSRGLRTVE